MMWKWLLNLETEFNKIWHITTNYADQNSVITPTYYYPAVTTDYWDIVFISQV
jgi:hypothetical protein